LHAGFIKFDDVSYVVENPLLKSSDGLRRIWLDPLGYPPALQYYPLTFTTFYVEHLLWKDRPRGYHATNIGLHAANALLLLLLLRRLRVDGAPAAALLFALHPLCVQSVAWIVERKNLLSAFFSLLTTLTFVRYLHGSRGRDYLATLVLFVLALLSKTAVCTLPLALLAITWWRRPQRWKQLAVRLVPLLLLSAILGLITVAHEQSYYFGQAIHRPRSVLEKTLVAGRALWFYAEKLVAPAGLVPIYPKWTMDPRDPTAYLWPAAAIAGLAVLWRLRRRLGRGPLVAAAVFMAMLAPVLGFVDFGYLGHSYVSDHFAYPASMAAVAALVSAAVQLTRPVGAYAGLVRTMAAAAVAVALGLQTWSLSRIYADPESFWGYIVARNPHETAYSALGDAYLRKGELEQAVKLLWQAVRAGDSSYNRYRLGELAVQRRQYAEAREHFRLALELNRNKDRVRGLDERLLCNLGMACWHLQEFEQARDYYRQALALDPDLEIARKWLARVEARIRAQATAPASTGPAAASP
jgi:Flp pilus assembly protein TadD